MRKTILKPLLAIVCLLSSITLYAHDFEVDGIYYRLLSEENQVAVTYYGDDEYDVPEEYKYTGSVTIPETVTYQGATYSVTSIGAHAFESCPGLTEVTIGNSVTSIGYYAFFCCDGLTEITIPNNVTSIGDRAFAYCFLNEISIPNSVTSIGYEAFYNCTSLTEVTIGNSVTSIGERAFAYCFRLTEVTIPNSVNSIGDGAFYLCEGLTEVTIGNSVTSIGEWAFAYCEGLTKMRIEAVNPPAIYDNTFEGVDKSIPLYVPAESVEAYRTADYWEYFINVSEDLSNSAVEDITSDNSDAPAEYYDLNGFRVNNPTHGIYIMKQGNTVRKVVL